MKRVKALIIMVITTIFIIGGFVWGLTNSTIAKAATAFPEGSTIAGINVGGITSDEALTLLLDEIDRWKNEGDLLVNIAGQKISIPYESIKFNVQDSIKELERKVEKRWYEFFKKAQAQQIPLSVEVTLDEDIVAQMEESVDVKQTIKLIEKTVSFLGDHEIEGVLSSETLLTEEVIAETTWTIPEDYKYIQLFIDCLNGLEIPANTNFSFNEQVSKEISHFNQKEANFIASMIYSLALSSNLQIVERESQGEIPSYSQAGLEAYVNPNKNIDLVVYNPGPTSYKFSVKQTDTELNMALLSPPVNTNHEYSIEKEIDVKYQTIVRYDDDLKPGHEQVIEPGQNGKRVEVYKKNYASDGTFISKELVARDFYLPKPKIVLKAPVTDDATGEPGTDQEDDLSFIDEILNSEGEKNETGDSTQVSEDKKLTKEQMTKLIMFLLKNMTGADEESIENPDDKNLQEKLTEQALDKLIGTNLESDSEGQEGQAIEDLTEEELNQLLGMLFLLGLLNGMDDAAEVEQSELK